MYFPVSTQKHLGIQKSNSASHQNRNLEFSFAFFFMGVLLFPLDSLFTVFSFKYVCGMPKALYSCYMTLSIKGSFIFNILN